MVRHPLADTDADLPAAVTAPDGTNYDVAADGTVDAPTEVSRELARRWAGRYDHYEAGDLGTDADDDADGTDADDADTADGDLPNPKQLTVSELRETLKSITDPDDLRTLRDAEENGQNRRTAVDAIEGRLATVTEG